eukprot:TRINITY_DN8529_c0_g1_i1.p1 TRINITY_DN8529_c0_g1~~TRINITY_DN8529_c0_g1_i1.p1  ORF type:complete len:996 (-),score=239.24 TRINITY_DN8529_c0_g1_i1:43-3030(-)
MGHTALFAVVLALYYTTFSSADVINNCGGFVKPSKALARTNDEKLDVSGVKLHLVTPEGQVKYSTDCAPNGYYIIPIYDKGTYNIKISAPDGFSFEREFHTVHIGGSEALCNNNFELTGFQVDGEVVHESTCGPSLPNGVIVTITDVNRPEKKQTATTTNGVYKFTNVFPGNYIISASHVSWSFSKAEAKVEVTWGGVNVQDKIVISGYDIRGVVTEGTETGEGVSGVHFLLYSKDGSQPAKCTKVDADLTNLYHSGKPVCGATSDSEGKFKILDVPCGDFELVPFHADAVTVFDVVPHQLKVEVRGESTIISSPFSVKGFSVRGRVITSSGEGISGVTISGEGFKDATTDSEGFYRLTEVTSDKYFIKASKVHHQFSQFSEAVKISPKIPQLPNIVATHYDICGTVSIPNPPSGVIVQDRVVIVSGASGEEKRAQTDKRGAYCISVKPGKYSVKPQVDSSEIESGLLLSAMELTVVVESEPVLDINFDQARLTVSGQVRCIESPCHNSISVSLSAVGRTTRVTTGLSIAHDDSSTEGHFVFKDVLPGKYEVTIHQSNWCWDKESQIVEVNTKDHSGASFVQTGYLINVRSSHDFSLKFQTPTGETSEKALTRGKNEFCVPVPGKYKFTPESCYQFSEPEFIYDTSAPEVLELNAEKFKIEGEIDVVGASKDTIIKVAITDLNSNGEKTEVPAITKDGKTYTYTVWAKLGDKLSLAPTTSESLFFYPRVSVIHLDQNACPTPLAVVKGRPGLSLSGKVTPAVAGVSVSVFSEEEYDTNDDAKPIVVLETNEKGTYETGPLYDDDRYVIIASHPAYSVKREKGSQTNFKLLKMASLRVYIKDDAGSVVSGVLLSLTSGEGYINNNNTNSEGYKDFTSLFPGEYYLKPVLKEYLFEPSSLAITLNEGEERTINFHAKRVAFSVHGHVKTLNGNPAKAVSVEAIGADGDYEETKTDTEGNYRLRGLIAGHPYTITTKLKDGSVERAVPESLQLVMKEV